MLKFSFIFWTVASIDDKTNHCSAFQPLVCVPTVRSQWCLVQSLSAFRCSKRNQLWQSCKLFLLGAKGGWSTCSLPVAIPLSGGTEPVGSCGPLICQAWKLQPGNLSDMQHIKRLFSVQREKMNKRWWIQFWGRAKGIQSSNHVVIKKLM